MFGDVDAYTNYLVRVVERARGACDDAALLRVAEYGARTYGRVGTAPCAEFCAEFQTCGGGFRGLPLRLVDCVEPVGGFVDRGESEACEGVVDDVCCGESGKGSKDSAGICAGGSMNELKSEPVVVGANHARNKLKKAKAKLRRERACGLPAREPEGDVSGVLPDSCESGAVPEWRRKSVGFPLHKGVFSECSVEVQQALRDSRARMLIAKNEAAVAEAEQSRRLVEARLKARSVEEEVERGRLESDKRMRALRAEVALPAGYAETVVSSAWTAVSDGSVSPSSSISVAEVKKKDDAIRYLVDELEAAKLDREEKLGLLMRQKLDLEKKLSDVNVKGSETGKVDCRGGRKSGRFVGFAGVRGNADVVDSGARERAEFNKKFESMMSRDEPTQEEMEETTRKYFAGEIE